MYTSDNTMLDQVTILQGDDMVEDIDPWELVINAIENNVFNPTAQSIAIGLIRFTLWFCFRFHK